MRLRRVVLRLCADAALPMSRSRTRDAVSTAEGSQRVPFASVPAWTTLVAMRIPLILVLGSGLLGLLACGTVVGVDPAPDMPDASAPEADGSAVDAKAPSPRDAAPTVDASTPIDAGPAEVDAAIPAVSEVVIAREGIAPSQLGLLVNLDDPHSVSVANIYMAAHAAAPPTRIDLRLGADYAATPTIPAAAFATWKAAIDAATPANVQAYGVTWLYPSKVVGMSITSAIAFGYGPQWHNNGGCVVTPTSAYFDSASLAPQTDLGIRPAMMIAATDDTFATALAQRGALANGTFPLSRGYLVRTTDATRSNPRSSDFSAVATAWNKPASLAFNYIDAPAIGNFAANWVQNATDVLFYLTGAANPVGVDTNTFVPGAVADHLTSNGGQVPTSSQMSALRWLEAGATGSFGTVVEPCAYAQKFPVASVLVNHYFRGETLIEAYWKSVRWPGEGLFIGDPLARPYGTRARVEGERVKITTTALKVGPYRVEAAPTASGPWSTVESGSLPHRQRVDIDVARRAAFFRLAQ